MYKALIYQAEQGLYLGTGELVVSLNQLSQNWNLTDSSIDNADLGDLFLQLGDNSTFYNVVKELWRCLKPNANIIMAFPHPRHDLFLSNPEYTRALIPETLEKFNSSLNDKWKALGVTYPRLAHRFGVNFEITSLNMTADPYWQDLLEKQQINSDDLNLASKQAYNVVSLIQITWTVKK